MAQILHVGLHYDFQPLQNHDRLQSRHHYSEFAEAYTPRGWQIASASPQGNRQLCAENESEVNRMITINFCMPGEMEAKV
jgi:hypothetical protein